MYGYLSVMIAVGESFGGGVLYESSGAYRARHAEQRVPCVQHSMENGWSRSTITLWGFWSRW